VKVNTSWIAIAISTCALVGSLAMLILNLVVTNRVLETRGNLQVDVANVRLELQQFRTEAKTDHLQAFVQLEKLRADQAQSQTALYQTVIKHLSDNFVDRKEAAAMHKENREDISELKDTVHDLSERVTDLG
jgi:uncharacterized membrane-anchored protein YhcB (DUF1043 family)